MELIECQKVRKRTGTNKTGVTSECVILESTRYGETCLNGKIHIAKVDWNNMSDRCTDGRPIILGEGHIGRIVAEPRRFWVVTKIHEDEMHMLCDTCLKEKGIKTLIDLYVHTLVGFTLVNNKLPSSTG